MLSFAAAKAEHYTVSSGRSVEAKADTLYEMVTKELHFTQKAKDKFKEIGKILSEYKQLLLTDEIKTEEAAYVQKYIVALQSLPESKGFKRTHCESYQVEDKAQPLLENLCN